MSGLEIDIGAELDIATKNDVEKLDKRLGRIEAGLFNVPYRKGFGNSGQCDVSGNLALPIFTCPKGYEFETQKVLIENVTDGYSYMKTVPVGGGASTGATPPLAFLKGQNQAGRLYATLPASVTFLGANQEQWFTMPYSYTWSRGQGLQVDELEVLSLQIALAAMANKLFTVTLDGWMRRIDMKLNRLLDKNIE